MCARSSNITTHNDSPVHTIRQEPQSAPLRTIIYFYILHPDFLMIWFEKTNRLSTFMFLNYWTHDKSIVPVALSWREAAEGTTATDVKLCVKQRSLCFNGWQRSPLMSLLPQRNIKNRLSKDRKHKMHILFIFLCTHLHTCQHMHRHTHIKNPSDQLTQKNTLSLDLQYHQCNLREICQQLYHPVSIFG